MWMICKKEWQQFFNSLTGYLAIMSFLIVCGLLLFVFPDTNLLDFGYANLDSFFNFSPNILIILIAAITMRSLADEYKSGTFELLKTLPLKPYTIVLGKFFGSLIVILIALLPTVVYAVSIQQLSSVGGIDIGATIGSYIGLFLLGGVFTAIGICASSFTNNAVIAFIATVCICFLLFSGFDAFSKLSFFSAGLDYYIEMMGIRFHYKSISRGVIDLRDIIYFLGLIFFCFFITQQNIDKR